MTRKERYQILIEYFGRTMPIAETELKYNSAFQLLVAVILSAQCTDKRVNIVTPKLFKEFPTPQILSTADPDEVLKYIHSISYPNSKAKHLVQMAQMLVKDYNGIIPSELEALLKLPGVGRKTANVILSVIYNKAAMAVDTHVFRLSHRIGLVLKKHTTPFSVEQELMHFFPSEIIPRAHHWLILHGRYTCTARNPKCNECGLKNACRYYCEKYNMNKHTY